MPLVQCPDCGRKVSEQAVSCPDCAHPFVVREEALEAASAAGGGGGGLTRPRVSRTARLVGLPTPPAAATAPEPPSPVARARRRAPTYAVVCKRCKEEEILAYQTAQTDGYICVTCEEAELLSAEKRRALLRWWPVLLVIALAAAAMVGWSRETVESRTHDSVAPEH